MERTYTTVDRTGWPSGPWDNEPDKVVWIDDATRLDCMVKRGPAGSLCGYVGVPPGHPWHGIDYSECASGEDDRYCGHAPDALIEVHGGLTYSASCWGDEAEGICHKAEPGRAEDVWWFGFDCAHHRDLSPGHLARFGDSWPADPEERYRPLGYVRSEVERLAAQLKAVG